MRFIAGVCAALAISAVGLPAATFTGTSASARATADRTSAVQAQAPVQKEITAIGCVRAWRPAPEDVTRMADNDKQGVAGIFLLTPLNSGPSTANEVPTYLLTPTQIVNFAQHLDDKVRSSAPREPRDAADGRGIRNTPPRPETKRPGNAAADGEVTEEGLG